jgi:hypothetical protein
MASIEPSGGSVVLRGIEIDLASDVGMAFTMDCCRFIEGLVTEEVLRKKFELDDAAWRQLETNEPLQRAVGAQKEKRIRSGEAAREKAAHLFLAAPDVLSTIMTDATASPRHRVDACRELRATAAVGVEDKPADGERIRISINFGTSKTRVDAPMRKIEPEHEHLMIEQSDGEHEGEYGF